MFKNLIFQILILLSIATPIWSKNRFEEIKRGTVFVETPWSNGSGTVIGRDGETYLIVINKHVINNLRKNENLNLYFYDNKKLIVPISSIKKSDKYDLAFIEVKTNQCLGIFLLYEVAATREEAKERQMKAYSFEQLDYNNQINVAGFSLVGKKISDKPVFRTSIGYISSFLENGKEGYSIGYTAPTSKGMSGGPIFTKDFDWPSFHGIHGRTETEFTIRDYQKTGYNFGISSLTIRKEVIDLGFSKYIKKEYKNFIPYRGMIGQRLLRDYCE